MMTLQLTEVAAMDDAQLSQFMVKHRRPSGAYELPVNGWDALSPEERNRLAQRLKAVERGLPSSPMAHSRPLDLAELNARLLQVLPSDDMQSRTTLSSERSESSTPLLDAEYYRTRDEIEYYHELVNDGGRPVYVLDQMSDVYSNTNDYEDVLRPWQESLTHIRPDGIFKRQWCRWQGFRKWQNDNRGREDDDGGFLGYVEWRKKRVQMTQRRKPGARLLAEIEADPSCLLSEWEAKQGEREQQRYRCREHGCGGFNDYETAVKRRLARHKFIEDFELNEEPKKQSKLATWIEYLNYEYWWLDKHVSDIERLQPAHDKAWQELVNTGVLRPHETKYTVRTKALALEGEAERDSARKAVRRAELEAQRIYRVTQEDPQRRCIPRERRISMLRAASTQVLDAKRRFEQVRNRNHSITMFIRGTWDYDDAKRDIARHRLLLQWVLDQIPAIKIEMARSHANRAISPVVTSTKRKLETDSESSGIRKSKKARLSLSMGSGDEMLQQFGMKQPGGRDVTNQQDHQVSEAQTRMVGHSQFTTDVIKASTTRGLRRSARIAARQGAVGTVLDPVVSLTEMCLKPAVRGRRRRNH